VISTTGTQLDHWDPMRSEPALRWRRVAAALIDWIMLAVVGILVRVAVGWPVFAIHASERALHTVATAIIGVALTTVYYVPVMLKTSGQTVGKRLVGCELYGRPTTAVPQQTSSGGRSS
jgi:uncharacterized RDD family membrane protein YckC